MFCHPVTLKRASLFWDQFGRVVGPIWAGWLLSGQWSRVGNACGLWFIRLLGRGLLCSRPFLQLPPPSGLPCMILPGTIGQSQLLALSKGWDEVGPDHPVLSVRIQVPLRPCLEVVLPQ
jgi:hypothetical protein